VAAAGWRLPLLPAHQCFITSKLLCFIAKLIVCMAPFFLCSGGITLTLRVPFGGVSTGDITHVLTSAAFCGLEPSSFSQNFTNGATASFTAETNTVTLLTLRAEPPIGTYTATLQVVSRG
jgi:hypothetical protein